MSDGDENEVVGQPKVEKVPPSENLNSSEQVETPEEKELRIKTRNMERLRDLASVFVAEKEAQERISKLQSSLEVPTDEASNPNGTDDGSEKQEKEDKDKLKYKLIRSYFRLMRKENIEEVIDLIAYIEENIPTSETIYKTIPADRIEAVKERYEKEGYEIHLSLISKEDIEKRKKVNVSFSRKIPLRIDLDKAEELMQICGKENNPEELLELLQQVGFRLDSTIKHGVKDLLVLIKEPAILSFLEKIKLIMPRKGYFYFGSNSGPSAAQLISWAREDQEKDYFNPDMIDKIRGLLEVSKESFSFGKIWLYIFLCRDENAILVAKLAARQIRYGEVSIEQLRTLQKEGLFEKILRLAETGTISSSFKNIFESSFSYREYIDKLKVELSDPNIEKLVTDEDAVQILHKANVLTSRRVSVNLLPQLQQLEKNPVGFSVLYLLSKWSATTTQVESIIVQVESILANSEIVEIVSNPKFQELADIIKKDFGCEISARELTGGGVAGKKGVMIEIFEDDQKREFIVSEKARLLAPHFKQISLRLDQFEKIETLAKHKDILAVLEKLDQFFNYKYELKPYDNDDELLANLLSNPIVFEQLFTEDCGKFYQRLSRDLYYSLRLADVSLIVQYATDQKMAELLFQPEIIEFVKSLSGMNREKLDLIIEIARVASDKDLKNVIDKLGDGFGYKYNYQDKAEIENLKNNPLLLEKVLDPERTDLIKRMTSALSVYKLFNPKDAEIICDLPLDFDRTLEIANTALSTENYELNNSINWKPLIEIKNSLPGIALIAQFYKQEKLEYKVNFSELIRTAEFIIDEEVAKKYLETIDQVKKYLGYIISFEKLKYAGILVDKNYSDNDYLKLQQTLAEIGLHTIDPSNIENLILLTENKEKINFIYNQIEGSGVVADRFRNAKELLAIDEYGIEQFQSEMNQCKKYDPDFRFNLSGTMLVIPNPDQKGNKSKIYNAISPIENVIFNRHYSKIFFEMIFEVSKQNEGIPENIIESYLKALTISGSRLNGKTFEELEPEDFESFGKIIEAYISKIGSASSKEIQQFFFDDSIIRYIFKDPKKIELITSFQGLSPSVHQLILGNLEVFSGFDVETAKIYLKILEEVDNSPSQEMQRIKTELIGQLFSTPNPFGAYKRIEDIFHKNNLPLVGKVFKVFQTINPPEVVDTTVRQKKEMISPFLRYASPRERTFTMYKDLLRVHILSGNRSLRDFIYTLKEGEEALKIIDSKPIGDLSEEEKKQVTAFIGIINTLFENSQLGIRSENMPNQEITFLSSENMLATITELKNNLQVREGQKINERLAEMFLKIAGFESYEELLLASQKAMIGADQRSRKLVSEQLSFKAGDLLKGVNPKFINNILQNGSVAVEFLGSGAGSDMTPYDTDLSMVMPQDVDLEFQGVINESMAKTYGDILLVVRDRGQFVKSEHDKKPPYDPEKYELFETGGKRHYGIRTGFPTTEIDYIIVQGLFISDQEKMNNLFIEIAQNGFYIPISDSKGNILFTPEMFDQIRETFDGIDKFGGKLLEFKPIETGQPGFQELDQTKLEIERNKDKTDLLKNRIVVLVNDVLAKNDIQLKRDHDRSLIGAEFLDTGSSGRHTNIPGSYDFDFVLKLDTKDMLKINKIVDELARIFEVGLENSHSEGSDYYLFKASGAKNVDSNPVDIDISFIKKSELINYGTHDSIEDKLNQIEKRFGEGARLEAISSIVLAKKILSEGGSYKKTDGGMGGIGIECWILANHGNFIEAFKTFVEAAFTENGDLVDLNLFAKKYHILSPGINLKKVYHDNFIDNMTKEGYRKMAETIRNWLGENNIPYADI